MKLVKIIVVILTVSEFSYVLALHSDVASTVGLGNESSLCTSEQCIMKCCPVGKHVSITRRRGPQKRQLICEDDFLNHTIDFESLVEDIFHEHPDILKLNLTMKAGIFEANKTFIAQAFIVNGLGNMYLNEYPEVSLEIPNAYDRWTRIPNDRFCWDYKIRRSDLSVNPGVWVAFPTDQLEYQPISGTASALLTSGLFISCFFLALVLVVYGILPELRNLSGQILMAYVASLFGACLSLAFMRMQLHEVLMCRLLTYLIYYCFLASFCWMNVMSFDIWWTSRDYGKGSPIHQRRKSVYVTFLRFCCYGFGLPLVMTIGMVIVNEIEMSHLPWFITPKIPLHGCFLQGGEKFLYLYIPMMILMSVNWVFYLMTGVNMWRLSRGLVSSVAAGSPLTHRSHRNRFMAFLKLSFVLCLNGILEVLGFLYPGYTFWYIYDFFSSLVGVVVFLIFVCRRKIMRKLVKRWRPEQTSLETTSSYDSEDDEVQKLEDYGNSK